MKTSKSIKSIIKTFQEILEIDSLVAQLYKKNPHLRDSKFGYAYKRFYEKNYSPVVSKMKEKLEILYIDNALEDEKTKAIILNKESSTRYSHSKEGQKAIYLGSQKISKEFDKMEITIEPYILSTPIPVEIDGNLKESLKGLIIQ